MALYDKNHWLLALTYALAVVLDFSFVPQGALLGLFNVQLGIAVAALLLMGLRATPYLIPGAILLGLLQATTPWLCVLFGLLHIAQALCIYSLLPLFAPERQIRILVCLRRHHVE